MNAAELLAKAQAQGWPTSSVEVLAATQAGREVDEINDDPPELVRPDVLAEERKRGTARMTGTL